MKCSTPSGIRIPRGRKNVSLLLVIHISSQGHAQKKIKVYLLRTFAGVLQAKIRTCAILKENTANYISLESLINVDFGKKYINCRFL